MLFIKRPKQGGDCVAIRSTQLCTFEPKRTNFYAQKKTLATRHIPVPSSTPSQECCVSPLPDQQPGNDIISPNDDDQIGMSRSKHSLQQQLGTYILGHTVYT